MTRENSIIPQIQKQIDKYHLLDKDGKHLVALSGGADSVALLLIMKEMGYRIEAIHCNFHLRGVESDHDEQFCVNLCEREQIHLHRVHFDTHEYAELHHLSIEMAARELRYHYFEQLRADIHADTICVAHHLEDSVETLLINLVRGTGIHGLRGIALKNGYIVRPLLDITRTELENYLKNKNQDFVTDSTNLTADFVRNKIRLEVIPLLKEINPSVQENIFKTTQRISEATKVFDDSIQKSIETVTMPPHGNVVRFSITKLFQQPSPEYTLYHILKDYHFTSAQIEQIHENLKAPSGKGWSSSTHELIIDRDIILIQPVFTNADKQLRLPEAGTYIWDENTKIKITHHHADDNIHINKDKRWAFLDKENVRFPLILRYPKTGDRFYPFGMNGSKLLSDYMTNEKMSLFDKQKQLVLTDADDKILWVVGQRADNRFRITGSTKEYLAITLSEREFD